MADDEAAATPSGPSESGAVATTEETTPAVPTAELAAARDAHREAVQTRVLIPLLLPLITAVAVLIYVLNLSRALLAGGKWGALAIASIITVTILVGAAFISSRPRLRTSTLVMLVSTLFALVIASGLTTIGPSEEKETGGGGGYQPPAGAPVATLSVTAEPALKFDATDYTVKAGVVQVNYVDGGGTHTLNFDTSDPNLQKFELDVPGGPKTGKVDLKPGKYTIYCNIPGHRAAGMQATITVQ
ncbi:MAG TPA: plastocyanin/azurin family copper-binding protein [Acidimicrobiia bacterium]|nr:plastocyanin/azurin family copper-binding protein [Acidimicrobiia bacterium]